MESLPQKLNVLLTTSLIPFASIAAKLCVVPTGNLYGVIRFGTPEAAAEGTAAAVADSPARNAGDISPANSD
jgi:hypothetical protein